MPNRNKYVIYRFIEQDIVLKTNDVDLVAAYLWGKDITDGYLIIVYDAIYYWNEPDVEHFKQRIT